MQRFSGKIKARIPTYQPIIGFLLGFTPERSERLCPKTNGWNPKIGGLYLDVVPCPRLVFQVPSWFSDVFGGAINPAISGNQNQTSTSPPPSDVRDRWDLAPCPEWLGFRKTSSKFTPEELHWNPNGKACLSTTIFKSLVNGYDHFSSTGWHFRVSRISFRNRN